MIWNDQVLFLHVPKTGGISVTTYLLENLQHAPSYTAEHRIKNVERAEFHEGRRHETLIDAEAFFGSRGRSVNSFGAIFATMRNPYDLEVSRFHYLHKGHAIDKGLAQDLAMAGDFKKYLRFAPFFGSMPPRLDRYFRIGDVVPRNLRVLRFEHLDEDLENRMTAYLRSDRKPLAHLNRSHHEDFWSYYDDEAEELCYRRHPWFFDMSFYGRGRPIISDDTYPDQ